MLFLQDTALVTWKKLLKCYNSFEKENFIITTVSPWLELRAKESPLLKNFQIKTVFNGVNTEIFDYKESAILEEKYSLGKQEKIIFHPTDNLYPM